MIRQFQTQYYLVLTLSFLLISLPSKEKERPEPQKEFDVVVLMATPGGIAAAISASRLGMKVVLIERTNHIGGLPANGMGETDSQSRVLASGIFKEFTDEIKRYYSTEYGVESQQFKDASDGFHFEPHVAEKVFTSILRKEKNIEILKEYQFDSNISSILK
jgi:pyruvate/2-oxoglutarate dehydrogenase complex dihydrolipoamide dehydrogenase (E3) component